MVGLRERLVPVVAGDGSVRVSFAELPPNSGGLIPTPQAALGGIWSVTFRNGEAVSGRRVCQAKAQTPACFSTR